ncbi:hypothetical protein [Streptomyces sp. NPDC003077]|uniref:hypothetical protein n=1 Tax=Streptomyces sp. NPDC003077 TaxID=3154443 RepID=UPI0033A3CFEE
MEPALRWCRVPSCQEVVAMEADPHRPDYPPKTPPPPKRPVEPPRPEPDTKPAPHKTALATRRPAVVIRNRRVTNRVFENAPWSPGKAARHVGEQLTAWGYGDRVAVREDRCAKVTKELVRAALGDGGKRVTVHVADQDDTALILVLSHQDGPVTDPDPAFLAKISTLGVLSCGTETERNEPGNRRWALLHLAH